MEIVLSEYHYRKLGRRIYSKLVNQFKLPIEITRWITKFILICINPLEWLRRKIMLWRLDKPILSLDKSLGFHRFNASDLPFGKETLIDCEKIFLNAKDSGFEHIKSSTQYGKGKPWRTNILQVNDFSKFPSILNFATSDEIITLASFYLGTVPVLGDIQLWWTIANEEEESSQLFHIDQEDFKQFKVFIHINDVNEDNGPLTFIDAKTSKIIKPQLSNPYTRTSDDEILSKAQPRSIIKAVAPKGSAFMLDTSSCFHQGSRTRKGERIVLVLLYVPYHCIREPHKEVLTVKSLHIKNKNSLTTLARMVL
jgi:hypothetical protein